MKALLPLPSARVDLVEAYAIPPHAGGRWPFVRANMISSLDGAVTVNGRSGMLGGPGDRRLFHVLRSWADVVLVGAGTMRSEGYGPVHLDDRLRRQRQDRGQSAVPTLAVVTRSGQLDWSSPFFTEAETRPLVFVTSDIDPGVRERGGDVADFVVAGEARVEPERILAHVHDEGLRSVLLEGGPGLNADVVHAGLLDELCLTLSPRLVAGDGPRLLAGAELAVPLDLEPVHVLEDDGFLFLRLVVRRGPRAAGGGDRQSMTPSERNRST